MIRFFITRQSDGKTVSIDEVALAHGGVLVRDFTKSGPVGLSGYRFTIAASSDSPPAPPLELTSMSTAEVADYLGKRIRDDGQDL